MKCPNIRPVIFLTLLTLLTTCVTFRPVNAQLPSVAANGGDSLYAASGIHGGLTVVVGCDDPDLIVSLAQRENVLVHGLVQERGQLREVRDTIGQAGFYGRASAVLWTGPACLLGRYPCHMDIRWDV